jgi:hypothetical protein
VNALDTEAYGSHRPDLIPNGEAFVKKWGVLGIFIGRFFGPFFSMAPPVQARVAVSRSDGHGFFVWARQGSP